MLKLKIAMTDNVHSGVSAKGNAYNFQLGFVHLPNMPYPYPAKFFIDSPLRAGEYEVPIDIVVDRETLTLKPQFDKALLLSK